MKMLFRLMHQPYWYDLALRTTIASTLKRRGRFTAPEIEATRATCLRLHREQRAFITDLQSEYQLSWSSMIASIHRPVDNDRAYHLRVKACFYHDFFKRVGLPELMELACAWDLISWSKGIDPARHGMRFSRPLTLGLDGSDCQFDFEKLL